jgi:hypothetical protein
MGTAALRIRVPGVGPWHRDRSSRQRLAGARNSRQYKRMTGGRRKIDFDVDYGREIRAAMHFKQAKKNPRKPRISYFV